MARRPRLDNWLVEQGLFSSRERARRAVMAGCVYVDGQRADKPGMAIRPGALVEVRGDPIPYVSRGGLKLAGALDDFGLTVTGLVCLDAGASTGGFTDCLLQRGAARVYAVDVGYGQLAWSLRNDPRVIVMERTNIRHLQPEQVGEPIDLATVDVSFISLSKVFPTISRLLRPGGCLVALVKPQFEAGPERVGKGGVVRDPDVHLDCLHGVSQAAVACGLQLLDVTVSPLRGPEGNIEFFLLARRPVEATGTDPPGIGRECPAVSGGPDATQVSAGWPAGWERRLAQVVAAAHREGPSERGERGGHPPDRPPAPHGEA